MQELVRTLSYGPAKAVQKAIQDAGDLSALIALENTLSAEEIRALQRGDSGVTFWRTTDDGRRVKVQYNSQEVAVFFQMIQARRGMLKDKDMRRLGIAREHIFTHGRSYDGPAKKTQGRKGSEAKDRERKAEKGKGGRRARRSSTA